jgi:hypothetical protein
MPTKRTAPKPKPRAPYPKLAPGELELMQKLRRVIRHKTSTQALHSFMYSLNDMVTTALIAEALDRIEKQQAAAEAPQ